MAQDKKDFIETILTWFRSPQVGNDEEIDRAFLSDAYDSIAYPQWISVEEELPPLKQDVLIYDEDEDVIIVDARWEDYYNNSGTNAGWEWSSELDPTHWMPLPQAPKGGGRSPESELQNWMRL